MPSLIDANANRQNGIEGENGLPLEATGRAVEEYARAGGGSVHSIPSGQAACQLICINTEPAAFA